jgi:hypothetical protein
MENDTISIYATMKVGSDSADAIAYPLYFPSQILEVVDYEFLSSSFDFQGICSVAWNFYSCSPPWALGVVFGGYTSTYPFCSVPPNEEITVMEIILHAIDTGSAEIDTIIFDPGECGERLYYTNAPRARDYGLHWTPVPVHVCAGICGDANGDGGVTTGDGYFLLNYLGAGPQPVGCCASNANGLDQLSPADGFWILNYFGGGPEPSCYPCEF